MDEQLESKFPEDWRKELKGVSGGNASTTLSKHRTGMSIHRTEMSEHRTNLSNTRSYLANERTHLAYLRTSLSLMSFGITLNRFSIYLRENRSEQKVHMMLYETQFVGLGMVIMGVAILGWALHRYKKVNTSIVEGNYASSERSVSLITISVILLGGLSAFWMIFNRLPGE